MNRKETNGRHPAAPTKRRAVEDAGPYGKGVRRSDQGIAPYAEAEERQEALYRFLLSRGDRWTSMEQATDSVNEYPAFFTGHYHNSRARRLLTGDIERINGSDHYDKIIVSGSRWIKLATEQDFSRFLEAELREVFRKLKRLRRIAKKGSRDQQLDMEGRIADVFLDAGK